MNRAPDDISIPALIIAAVIIAATFRPVEDRRIVVDAFARIARADCATPGDLVATKDAAATVRGAMSAEECRR